MDDGGGGSGGGGAAVGFAETPIPGIQPGIQKIPDVAQIPKGVFEIPIVPESTSKSSLAPRLVKGQVGSEGCGDGEGEEGGGGEGGVGVVGGGGGSGMGGGGGGGGDGSGGGGLQTERLSPAEMLTDPMAKDPNATDPNGLGGDAGVNDTGVSTSLAASDPNIWSHPWLQE